MIYIIGAGPGDPDLISIKGAKLLSQAELCVYAGSLVNPELLELCKKDCPRLNSAQMTLEEVVDALHQANQEGKLAVRLHTGDPSLYGAIQEQIDKLISLGDEVEVIPGISSFSATAASIQREFTLPGVSQTLVISRIAGRTSVPSSQSPRELAKLKASYAFFLSVTHLDRLSEELIAGGLSKGTPCAAIYKASWPDEQKVFCTLENLAEAVRAAGFKKTTMILVGDFMRSDYERSKLYDPSLSHMFRDASK